MLTEELKNFVEQNIQLIEEYRFNELYNKCYPYTMCTDLTNLLMSISLQPVLYFRKDIPKYAYLRNEAITRITIPEGITHIDLGAFYQCENLTEVTLPQSLENIGLRSFSNCPFLDTVYYEGTSEQWKLISNSLNPFLETKVTQIRCKDEVIEWNPYNKEN